MLGAWAVCQGRMHEVTNYIHLFPSYSHILYYLHVLSKKYTIYYTSTVILINYYLLYILHVIQNSWVWKIQNTPL